MNWLWNLLRRFVALLNPFALVQKLRPAPSPEEADPDLARQRRRRSAIFWVVHFLLLAAVLVGLWLINRFFNLGALVRSPWPALRELWLPLLFLTLYLVAWAGAWLWRLLGPSRDAEELPDIDEAWNQALHALGQAGVNLNEQPLFLVLGRATAPMESLFAAAGLPLQVRNAPSDPDAPLRVFAGRDGIFITCEGACLLARQSEVLREETEEEEAKQEPTRDPFASFLDESVPGLTPVSLDAPEEPAAPRRPLVSGPVDLLGADLSGEESLFPSLSIPAPGPSPSSSGRSAVLTIDELGLGQRRYRRRQSLLRNTAEVERQSARLRYVCRKIARARDPYCPVNGILVVVPLAAAKDGGDARQTAEVCRHDLSVARQALQVDCPRLVLVADLDHLPGFADLVARFPARERRRWVLGQPFPLMPDVDPAELPTHVEDGVRWIGETLLPVLAYKLLRSEADDPGQRGRYLAENSRLYRMVDELRRCMPHLGRLVSRGLLSDEARAVPPEAPPLYAGCYLAGAGPDAQRDQGFATPAFYRLVECQNAVAWARAALAEENAYRSWTAVGYLALAAFLAVLFALAMWWR